MFVVYTIWYLRAAQTAQVRGASAMLVYAKLALATARFKAI